MKIRNLFLLSLLLAANLFSFAQGQLEFIENRGQWGNWFKYKAAAGVGEVCFENDGFRYVLCDRHNNARLDSFHHGLKKDVPVLKFHCYKVSFLGAGKPVITGQRPFQVYYNYFHGNDSSRWKSGIHPVHSINYSGLYPGIDVHVGSEKGQVTYDFIVAPGADVGNIKLSFEGQQKLSVVNHHLVISTSVGDVTELKPYVYQYVNNEKVEVTCNYQLNENVLSFDFPDDYDHAQPLFIDPTVVFCTLTGSTADNWGFTATYDDSGYFYNGGLVNTLYFGGTFPVSPGAFQTTFGGGYSGTGPDSTYASDISIIKYDPTGRSRIYATYLGGSGNERPHSMIVNSANQLIVAGRSRSIDYPVTAGAFQTVNHGGWDIVVTEFNATGTALVGSTYVGGSGNDGVNFDSTELMYGQLKFNYGDDARSEVQVDRQGNIYVADCSNSTDFPVTPATALSTSLSGMQDGVVIKLNASLTSLLWSTYLSGNGSDAAYVLAFDTSQAYIYVAGGTNSTDFPVTAGSLHAAYQGGAADGFVLAFKNSVPYNRVYGTYVGTSNYDQIYGIQVSGDNHVYVMGQSLGGSFPVTPAGVYSNPRSCQFVMKMDSTLATDLISTVFGNQNPDSTNISPVAFLVDTCENVYISGWGGDLGLSSNFVASGTATLMPVTPDAIRLSSPYGRDFYFIVLGPGLTSLRYATYYGRNCPLEWEGAHVDGGTSRFSRQGIIYQAMCANCGGQPSVSGSCPDPFPTTSGVWSMLDSSLNCNEAALKIAFNIGPVTANIIAGPSTAGCAPLVVDFTNLSNNGLTYLWNFGDGSATTTAFSPSHTFTAVGVYTVTLSAANSNACFRTNDTAHLIITVGSKNILPSFVDTLTDSCGPFVMQAMNTSVDTVGTPSYQWFFGDGASFSGANPTQHVYADTGVYVITLVMTDTAACKSPDTVTHLVRFSTERVTASFKVPDSVCLGTPIVPNITFTNVNTTTWSFGDGQTSTGSDPTHTYAAVGTYTITLIAANTAGCGGRDTLTETVKVLSLPVANFTFTPITPEPNIATTFTNLSVNANRYSWDFGDNTTSIDVNPVHQYTKTGNYKVCLTAFNFSGCPSTLCKEVPADVLPLIGVPTAFSPNNDGENDFLFVKGAAIEKMDLKIFNRWGQLVFETIDPNKGWDGTFNGQPQPIDAYAYVLNVTFIDGTSKLLKGNITLLR